MNNEDIAYAAGLYEGEGCVSGHPGGLSPNGKRYMRIAITIKMTDREPLERFVQCVGHGKIYGPYIGAPPRKPAYMMQISGAKNVAAVMEAILPWLSPRRKQQYMAAVGRFDGGFHG